MNLQRPVSSPTIAEIPYFRDSLRVKTMADIEAFEETPLDQRDLPNSTYEMLEIAAKHYPDRPALYFFESGDHLEEAVVVSQRDFFANVTRAANLFTSFGMKSDDVIGLLGPATPEMQYALWGGEAAGIICPINWMLDAEIIAHLMNSAGITYLAAHGPDPEFEIWDKIETIRRRVPGLKGLIRLGGKDTGDAGVTDFAVALAEQPSTHLISGRVFEPTQTASFFHTGGTTGTPKLARHTHGNEVFMTWISALQYGVNARDVRICGVPLFHVNGVLTNSLMPIARGAATVIATRGGWRDPSVLRNLWRIIENFGVTILPMVPSVVNSTLSIPFEESDISCLQVATSGTAPLSPTVAHEFEARTEAKIIEGYGLTETTAVSAANPRYGESRIGSIGFRKAYQPMKVVEIDASGAWQRDCAPGETGIVAISGPNVIPGYLDESANDKLFVAPGWLNTGDIGHQDQDGYFWLTGRAKDLIIRGGHNLDPKLIEEAFYAHEAIAEAAAVGMPDAKVGELPVVYVTLKPGKSVRPGRLNFHAYEAIQERAAVPKQIHILDTMPKTAVGKIQKNILRDDAVRRCAAEIVSAIAPLEHWRIETETGDGGQIRCAVHVVAGAPNAHSIFAKACEQMKSLTAPITVYPSPKQS